MSYKKDAIRHKVEQMYFGNPHATIPDVAEEIGISDWLVGEIIRESGKNKKTIKTPIQNFVGNDEYERDVSKINKAFCTSSTKWDFVFQSMRVRYA